MRLYNFIYSKLTEAEAVADKDSFPVSNVDTATAVTNPLLLPTMVAAQSLSDYFKSKPADSSAGTLDLPRKEPDAPKTDAAKPEPATPAPPKPQKSKTRSEFEQEFARQRRMQGAGGTFMFRGKPYSTNYREEGLPGKTNEDMRPISTAGAGGIAGMQSPVPAAGDAELAAAASDDLSATTEKPQDPNAENQKIVPGQTVSETARLKQLAGL